MPVPPALQLLAAFEGRARDEGARAAAASPSVRPGEINKTQTSHRRFLMSAERLGGITAALLCAAGGKLFLM